MNNRNRFDHYRQLLKRVDEKFSEIFAKHQTRFQCGRGCFGCCKAGLNVSNVEAEHIRSWLNENPEIVAMAQKSAKAQYHGDGYCDFLSKDGECLIYEVRPIICRSHGAPVLVPDAEGSEGELVGDVCPLNFADFDLRNLPQSDWIRVDTLNMILARIDLDFDSDSAGQRKALSSILDSATIDLNKK